MKQIKNLDKATVFDCETNGFLHVADRFHVLSFKMKNKPVMSIEGDNHDRIRAFFKWHIDNEIPVIAHNGIMYDLPVAEKILNIDLSELMICDTLILSWYLNIKRQLHGLGSFHDDYGIPKPPIDDWENLTYEEYKFRCETDVEINVALWEDLYSRLRFMYKYVKEEVDKDSFGGRRLDTPDGSREVLAIDGKKGWTVDQHINDLVAFLCHILDTYKVQQDYGIKLDVPYIEQSMKELEEKISVIKLELEAVMPKIPKYTKKKKPAKCYKQNGELSASGKSWEDVKANYENTVVDEFGTRLALLGKDEPLLEVNGEMRSRSIDNIEEFQVLSKYEEPNADSPQQIKDLLFSHGWEPCTYAEVKDKAAETAWRAEMDAWRAIKGRKPPKPERPEVRLVPQVTVKGESGKELTDSVLKLAESIPAIKMYADYNLYRHRLGVLKGFLENRDHRGRIIADIGGITSTIRQRHRGIVNLPGVMVPYGVNIRGSLIADDGDVLLGSDLSSLESVLSMNFMLVYDPEYVKKMLAPDWDSHIETALAAGLITKHEYEEFKKGNKLNHVVLARKQAKTCNYASQYNAGPETIAKGAGVSLALARDLHSGYWKVNWSIKAIAEEQVVLNFKDKMEYEQFGYDKVHPTWLINPINGFLYELRKDSDRYSCLIQGLGAYVESLWIDEIFKLQIERYKKRKLIMNIHDEVCISHKDTPRIREAMGNLVKEALVNVNNKLLLRKEVTCDFDHGFRYSDIH